MSQKSSVHVGRESDDRVVPAKCPNKDGKASAEGRPSAKENKNLGVREPGFYEWFKLRPGDRVFLTPTPERAAPTLADLLPKTVETDEIPGHGVVVEVALHHTSQPLRFSFQRIETVLKQKNGDHPYPDLRFDAKYLR
jgi:hypothetical protein